MPCACRVPQRCRLQCGVRRGGGTEAGAAPLGDGWACCVALGKFGLPSCDEKRAGMMSVAWVLALLQFLLALCSLSSVGTQKHTVMNLAWTIGESETQEMFVGLEALVLQRDYGSTKVVTFTDSECIDNFCDLCYDSSIVTVFWVAVCFVLTIPPLFINYNRASKKRDRNVQKFWGMVLPVIGLIACITALTNFLNGCYYHLPQADQLHSDISWVVGPGSICLLASLALKPFDIIMHMLIPVTEDEDLIDEIQNSSSFHL